jgi:hypothetical protein
LSIATNGNKVIDTIISLPQSDLKTISFSNKIDSSISYYCNRGIGVQLYNGSIACFCPPQYFGDKCQFYIDRNNLSFSS